MDYYSEDRKTLSTKVSEIDLKVVTPVKALDGQCPFFEFGCEYAGETHELKQHIRESPTKHLSLLCDAVRDMHTSYNNAQLHNESEELRLNFLDFRFRELETIFSKQLIWRVDNVRNLIREARDDFRTSIFSPPFYTGKQGYKLAASLAFNGDGDAKGQYVSIFITILHGEYDSLLPWPFAHSIKFTLVDQQPSIQNRCHVEKRLQPNTCKENRSFLGRPLGDRNPRFGIKQFVQIKQLLDGDYLKNEAIFVKVDIDQVHVTKM